MNQPKSITCQTVINLTTRAIPKEAFLSIGGGIAGNTETTGQLGYTYYGSRSDFTGFDNGARNVPPALAAFLGTQTRIESASVATQKAIASQIVTARNSLVQRNGALPPNYGFGLTGGKSFDVGSDATVGVIATFGFNSRWRTRDTLQQSSSSADLSQLLSDFERVITENRIVVNGLVGLSVEAGRNKLRFTNLFIRDTLKQARIGNGARDRSNTTATQIQQDTAWFDRQLLNSQLVGEFKLSDSLSLDTRLAFANTHRNAPFELSYEYFRSNSAADPFGAIYVNRLNRNQGQAQVVFSRPNENLMSGGLDLSYKIIPEITGTVGYAYTDTDRRTERRAFQFTSGILPRGVDALRPDLLLQPVNVLSDGTRSPSANFGIGLIDPEGGDLAFRAKLRIHAVYGQVQADITPKLALNIGARFETARQSVAVIPVVPVASLNASTNLQRDYVLPGATLTWKFRPDMQIRINGSKTIARPQFRELIFQRFYDPDANRNFQGNPRLVDSQLYNAEARYEWYFGRDQRFALGGFYKRINNPIEAFVGGISDNAVTTSFANAPSANLYGGEVEGQKYVPLAGLPGPFFASRRGVLIANYTYTKSRIKVGANDQVAVFPFAATAATGFFRDGSPLTGQSNHLVNLQVGLEDTDRLSQQTLLFSYASRRVTSRGFAQPDVIEVPGIQLDFVARQGIKFRGLDSELKFEARNITGTRYQEFQQSGVNRINFNLYRVGTTLALSYSVNF